MRRLLAGRLAALAGITLLLAAPVAPAAAAESGTLVGRVLNGSTKEPVAGVEVTLTASRADGSRSFARTQRTDDDGRYRFKHLPTGTDHIYTVDATYEGGAFAGGALQLRGDTPRPPVVRSLLRVWPTITDPAVIQIARDDIFAVQEGGDVSVIEAVTVVNHSGLAYIGRGGGTSGRASSGSRPSPSLGFALPASVTRNDAGQPVVQIVGSDVDLPQIIPTEYGFAATAAIPPGETRITFAYRTRGTGGSYDLTRRALYPTSRLEVNAAPPLEVQSNRLIEAGTLDLRGRAYTRYSATDGLAAGDPIQVLAVATAEPVSGSLLGVALGAIAVLALVAAGTLWLSRRRAARRRPERARRAPTQGDLLHAIAELDMRYERGELAEAPWSEERARLKAEALQGSR